MSSQVAALSDEAVVRYVLQLGPLATLEQNPLALQKAAMTLFELRDAQQLDEAAVRRTFKKLVLRVHPDKNHASNAHEAFHIVHTCFEFLLRRPAFVGATTTSAYAKDKTPPPPPPRAPAATFTTRPESQAKAAVPLTRTTSAWLPRTVRPAATTTTSPFVGPQASYRGVKNKDAGLYRRTVSSTRNETTTASSRPTFSYAAWGAGRLRRSAAQWREVERWASSTFNVGQHAESQNYARANDNATTAVSPVELRGSSTTGACRGLPPRGVTRSNSGLSSPLASTLNSHLSAPFTPPPPSMTPLSTPSSSSSDSDLFAAVRLHTSSSSATQPNRADSRHASQAKTGHSRTVTHSLSAPSSSSSSSSPFSSSLASTRSAFAATASCVLDRNTARRTAHRPALPTRSVSYNRAVSHATPSSSTVSSPAFASLGMTV